MSLSTLPKTSFAPAERVSFSEIQSQAQLLRVGAALAEAIERMPVPVFVTNSCRQLVLVNAAMLKLLNAENTGSVLGLRIGEAFACPRSADSLGGCGTTEACWGCAVTTTIIAALETGQATGRCQIGGLSEDDPPALHFQENACSFDCAGEKFVLVFLNAS